MINKIEEIDFKEIKRISPSQYYSMKNCAYKSLLAEAFEKKPLLPVSPNAYFGTVLHRMQLFTSTQIGWTLKIPSKIVMLLIKLLAIIISLVM